MSFLNITLPKGSIGQTAVKQATQKWETLEESRAELVRHGFPPPSPPGSEVPRVTAKLLDNISSPLYLQRYTELNAWYGFGEAMKGSYEAELGECKTALGVLAATIKREMKQDNDRGKSEKGHKALTPDDYRNGLMLNTEYQELLLRAQKVEQKLIMLTADMKGMFRALQLMSRNIEMKRLELTGGSGVNNWNPRTRAPEDHNFRRPPVLGPHEPEGEEDGEEE